MQIWWALDRVERDHESESESEMRKPAWTSTHKNMSESRTIITEPGIVNDCQNHYQNTAS